MDVFLWQLEVDFAGSQRRSRPRLERGCFRNTVQGMGKKTWLSSLFAPPFRGEQLNWPWEAAGARFVDRAIAFLVFLKTQN
jgi:hypothetical protein